MKDELVSLKTAKLAKEKGFDLEEGCACGGFPDCICLEVRAKSEYYYQTTQSLLQRWLREVHGIFVVGDHKYIDQNKVKTWIANITFLDENASYGFDYYKRGREDFPTGDTYEQALEAGLFEALKLIKND